jgi:trimethylamine---corrinoid protein Co-methyltransferase
VTASNIVDPYTGERRLFTRQDAVNVTRLRDALPNLDFVMALGLISDCPVGLADREEFEALVLNTNKPLVGWANEAEGYADIVEMVIQVKGSLEELQRKPFFALLADPTTPLSHLRVAVQKLLYLAEKNLPNLYLGGPMQGMSTPVTPAGSVLITNVEMIAGLLLCQLKREGSSLIYCGCPAPMDMKIMTGCRSAPEGFISIAAMAEVAQFYHLPTFGIAGCSEAKVFDEQAAIEGAVGATMAAMSGSNMYVTTSFDNILLKRRQYHAKDFRYFDGDIAGHAQLPRHGQGHYRCYRLDSEGRPRQC